MAVIYLLLHLSSSLPFAPLPWPFLLASRFLPRLPLMTSFLFPPDALFPPPTGVAPFLASAFLLAARLLFLRAWSLTAPFEGLSVAVLWG